MKKLIAFLSVAVMTAAMSVVLGGCGGNGGGAPWAEFGGGDGTSASPYVIDSAIQWKNVSNHPEAHFKLSCDINLIDEQSVEPIGNSDTPFRGTFDGCGYSIKGAKVSSSHNVGLFGATSGATIKNLNFSDSTVSMSADYNEFDLMGSFVAVARKGTVIENCHTENVNIIYPASNTKYVYVGGFAGSVESLSEISYCSSNVKIKQVNSYDYARFYIGGLVGKVNGSEIECCSARGSVDVGSPISLGSSLRVSAICDTVRESFLTGIYTEMNFTGGSGVNFYYFAGDVDSETLKYCLNFGEYNCKYTDRYGKCGTPQIYSNEINRYVSAEDYKFANDFLDGNAWENNVFWEKGKLFPQLISYEKYCELK